MARAWHAVRHLYFLPGTGVHRPSRRVTNADAYCPSTVIRMRRWSVLAGSIALALLLGGGVIIVDIVWRGMFIETDPASDPVLSTQALVGLMMCGAGVGLGSFGAGYRIGQARGTRWTDPSS
jgi:hypothetical protein